MVFFNDPVPIPDPAERAVKMAIAMREAAGTLIAAWRRRGRMLGFGLASPKGMQRSARLVLLTAQGTQRSVPYAIWPRAFAERPRTTRSLLLNASPSRLKIRRRLKKSASLP